MPTSKPRKAIKKGFAQFSSHILDVIPDMLVRVHRDGTILDYRPSSEFEPLADIDAAVGGAFDGLLGPEISARIHAVIERVLETGRPEVFEETLTRKGIHRVYRTRVVRVEPDEVLMAVRNLTSQRDIEEALRASEERFRLFMENSPAAAYIKDTRGRYIFANRAWADFFGMRPEEIAGRTVTDLFPKEIAAELGELDDYVRRTGLSLHKVVSGRTLKGREFSWRLFKFAMHNSNNEPLVGGVCMDVTEARRSRDRLVNIIENMPVMLIAFDDVGRVMAWNRECERVTGYTRGEMLYQRSGLEKLLPDPIYRREMEKYIIEQQKPFRDLELGLRCKDGSDRVISWSNLSREFPVAGWKSWAIGQDITEKLKDKHRMEQLFMSLSEKNEELQSLAHITSHDLRSPFVNVKGFAGELRRSCEELRDLLKDVGMDEQRRNRLTIVLEDEIPEALHFIDTGISRMDKLLEGLSKLSRAGRYEMHPQRLDMQRVAQEALSTVRYATDTGDIEVQVDPLCPAWGDETQVTQVMTNLVRNAVNYMSPGRPGRIHLWCRENGDEAVYCVEDNGVGIREESQREIFELFKRLDPDGPVAGEGLGLTIVKRIVGKHNGRVWVESDFGEGSKFFFSLPRPV